MNRKIAWIEDVDIHTENWAALKVTRQINLILSDLYLQDSISSSHIK